MSIQSKQYAELVDFIFNESKDDESAKRSIGKLAKVITENHDQGKLEEIEKDFDALTRKKEGIVEVKIVSAREISKKQEELLREVISKKLGVGVKLVEVSKEVDKTLIGGISIQIGDEVIDGSLNTKFEKLENSLT